MRPFRKERVAHFDDLHESVKKRWRDDPNYRPPILKKFEQQLNAWANSQSRTKQGKELSKV